jgi:four helix bundle protein
MPMQPEFDESDGHGHGHGHGPRNTMTDLPAEQTTQRRRRNDLHQLDVYRCALQLYRRVRRIVEQFARGEADLRSQMRRASRSVPFNIGEGVGKRGRARAAAYEIALGETKEIIVALDCVEIDELAPLDEIVAAQDLADRIAAMLTRLIASAELQGQGLSVSQPR